MRILVDFDDTLHQTHDKLPGHRMGQPEPGAIAAIRQLAINNEIIVFTGRRVDVPSVYEAVASWMEYFQIPYHGITNVKPQTYDLIIDNRAMHYDSWPQVLFRIRNMNEEAYTMDHIDIPGGD